MLGKVFDILGKFC